MEKFIQNKSVSFQYKKDDFQLTSECFQHLTIVFQPTTECIQLITDFFPYLSGDFLQMKGSFQSLSIIFQHKSETINYLSIEKNIYCTYYLFTILQSEIFLNEYFLFQTIFIFLACNSDYEFHWKHTGFLH